MRIRAVVLIGLAVAAGCSVGRSGLRHDDDGGPRFDAGDVDAFVPPVDLGPSVDEGSLDGFVPPVDFGPFDAFEPPADLGPPDAFVPPVDSGPSCAADATRCRDASTLETCTGTVWTSLSCALGCAAAAPAHCLVMVPSNIDSALVVDGGNVTVMSDVTWDTGSCGGGGLPGMPVRVTQLDGGDVCVVRVHDLTINARVRVQGPIPLVVLAQGEITIGGTLDASAYGTVEGPGGGIASTRFVYAGGPSAGGDGGHSGTYADAGGGGGGFCGAGANGGAGGGVTGGIGGAAVATSLSPLIGGSGGGTGGTGESTGVGGAGGGAVQLSALVRVRVTGSILAGGGGGQGGLDGTAGDYNIGAGGGGGSGGAILIESPLVELSGMLRASGGGGGGAASCRTAGNAGNGEDGASVAGPPSGGVRGPTCMGGNFGGAGGDGAADATLHGTDGASNGAGGANGAGGGGGAGGIVIRDAAGTLPAGGAPSPSIAPGLQALPLRTI